MTLEERNRAQTRRGLFGIIRDLNDVFGVKKLKNARDKIIEINQRLSTLESKAEQAKAALQDHEARLQDHKTRIEALEQ
jgi:chromosome segregation ATPase